MKTTNWIDEHCVSQCGNEYPDGWLLLAPENYVGQFGRSACQYWKEEVGGGNCFAVVMTFRVPAISAGEKKEKAIDRVRLCSVWLVEPVSPVSADLSPLLVLLTPLFPPLSTSTTSIQFSSIYLGARFRLSNLLPRPELVFPPPSPQLISWQCCAAQCELSFSSFPLLLFCQYIFITCWFRLRELIRPPGSLLNGWMNEWPLRRFGVVYNCRIIQNTV